METPVVSILLLAIPAAGILALLLEYMRRNHGNGVAGAFVVFCGVYGIARGNWVLSISESHGAPMPYHMVGAQRIGAAAPMELVGWMLASALAWQAGASLVRAFGARAGKEPPFRTAFGGSLLMAALSLAVETAAIAAGWWRWSIPPPPGAILRVPVIGLVDWAFVAFDFLLPFLLFSRPSRRLDRVVSLTLFPIHFLSHLYLNPPFPSVPLSFFEAAHFGIPLWIFWRALGEKPPADRARPEWARFVPGASALLIAAVTVLATCLAGEQRTAVFIAPLGILGTLTLLTSGRREPRAAPRPAGPRMKLALRVLATAVTVALLLFVRLPANQRRDTYARSFAAGVEKLNAGDLAGAERLLREAVTARPDKAEPHLILGLALIRLGRVEEAARELDASLRIKPELAQTEEAKALRLALTKHAS